MKIELFQVFSQINPAMETMYNKKMALDILIKMNVWITDGTHLNEIGSELRELTICIQAMGDDDILLDYQKVLRKMNKHRHDISQCTEDIHGLIKLLQ